MNKVNIATNTQSSNIADYALDFVYRVMQIDEEWSIREEGRFTWWGYNLAQRVWADTVAYGEKTSVSVQAETDILCDVPDTEETTSLINSLNRYASLSAWVWDKERRQVKLVCSLRCDEENVASLEGLLASAVAIQCADAHRAAGQLAGMLQCKLNVSHHPVNGPRPVPDEMLGVREDVFAARPGKPSPFIEQDFAKVAQWLRNSILAIHSERGLTAEFPFWGDTPVVVQLIERRNPIRRLTSLLQVDCLSPHPVLGSGLLMLLKLPVTCDEGVGPELGRSLNLAEAAERNLFSQLGGWCWDPDLGFPVFASFVPAAPYHAGMLYWLVQHMACRSSWARRFVEETFGSDCPPPPEIPNDFSAQPVRPKHRHSGWSRPTRK